jgi:hypothetical protein
MVDEQRTYRFGVRFWSGGVRGVYLFAPLTRIREMRWEDPQLPRYSSSTLSLCCWARPHRQVGHRLSDHRTHGVTKHMH